MLKAKNRFRIKTSNNLWTFNGAGPRYVPISVDASILELARALKLCTFSRGLPFRRETLFNGHTHYWKGYCGVREVQW